MKFFDFDWSSFLGRLRTWNELSPAARGAYLTLTGSESAAREKFGPDLTRLLAEQWLTAYTDGRRVRLHDTARPLAAVLRAMGRHPLMAPSHQAFMAYLHEHFTQEELRDLRHAPFSHESQLPEQAASETWLAGFLSANALSWIAQRLYRRVQEPDAATVAAAQALVRAAMHGSEPLELHALPDRFPAVPPDQLSRAVRLAVRLLLLFPRLRGADLVAVIGLWPSLTARLHRPKPTPPAAVEAREPFHLAFRVEDMTVLLVACASGTVRVRAHDGGLYAKAEAEIDANLIPLPAWFDDVDRTWQAHRLSEAQHLLFAMQLLTRAGHAGRNLHLVPTATANQWLADSAEGRLRQVIQYLQPTRRLPSHSYCTYHDRGSDALAVQELCRRAAQAFAQPPARQFSAWGDFLRWHTEMNNPLLDQLRQPGTVSVPGVHWSSPPGVEHLEQLWGNILRDYLCTWLVPLGGVEAGLANDGRLAFRLTDVGRYMLGLTDRFSYRPHEAAAGGELVVQPNFEVVFLAPSPLAEAALVRCAERNRSRTHGRGVGALFTITKASIFAAAATGMTADQVLTMLRELSRQPLPANVAREIHGWFAQCRRATVRRAALVHCPDADTAARVVAASGRQAHLLTDTIVEFPDARFERNLIKKLKTMGIFLLAGGETAAHTAGVEFP